MTVAKKLRLLHGAACFMCFVFTSFYAAGDKWGEFAGGRITGPIFTFFGVGSLVFLASVPIALHPLRRVAAAVTLLASLLCLPLYLYILLPGPFRRLFPGNYKVLIVPDFYREKWAILGMLSLVLATYLGWRSSRAGT